MPSILIVDDSQVDCRLAGGLLAKNPDYRIQYAEDGQQALAVMERGAADLVVTDLVMPRLNGLELVRAIRARYPQVPVILMTAYGNEAIAVDALEQGAASYVPKAQQAERLVETVERVLGRAEAHRRRGQLLSCLGKIDSSFYLSNDPALIPPLIDLIQQTLAGIGVLDPTERIRVGVALEEGLLNALYHGNLELRAEELSQARANRLEGGLTALVEQRRGQPPYRERRIVFEAHLTTYSARFVIRDEGTGFDLNQTALGEPADRFERGRNRGLMLMNSFMDEVRYNAVGNEVTLIKLAS